MATRTVVKGGMIRRFVDPSQSSMIPGIQAHFDVKPRWMMMSLDEQVERAGKRFAKMAFLATVIYLRCKIDVPKIDVPPQNAEAYDEMNGNKYIRIVRDIVNPFMPRFDMTPW